MKITSLSQARRFIQDESGVYTVMGGLLALPILALIFVSLESAGIIQDQARLSDSLEQAVLSLTAENNSGRKENDYKLSGSNKENESFDINSEVGKRDNQMVTAFVKSFLPQTKEKAMRLTPICKTVNTNNKKGHTSSSEVTCTVSGTIEHKSWFPLKVGSLQVIPQQVDVASKSRAFKKNTFNIPIDLMVVADLSGSMDYDLTNKHKITGSPNSKIEILKDVLSELAEKSLFTQDSNSNNRIAVAPFALGAQYSSSQCIIPFVLRKDIRLKNQISDQNITNYLLSKNKSTPYNFALSLAYLIDIEKTINSIGGSFPSSSIIFNKNKFCLGRRNNNSHHWYNRDEFSNFFSFIKKLHAEGSTLASSGLITASNIMLKEESRSKSLGEQTKRVILVLSDGNDELHLNDKGTPFTQYSRITENLLLGQEEQTTDTYPYFMSKPPKKLTSNINVCDRIRNKLDEHNEDKNTKIVFVEFGYASKARKAWEHCVGNGNYYSANDKASLLNSFKQAIGETDDVGRSIN